MAPHVSVMFLAVIQTVVDPARSSTELMAANIVRVSRNMNHSTQGRRHVGWKYLEYQQPKPVQLPPQKEDDVAFHLAPC